MARYIDADEFDTYLRLHHFPSKIMYKGKTIYDYLKEYAGDKAKDVKENVRGEWIFDEELENVYCSKCRHLGMKKYKYCPYCGADMRGVK